jgi:hypothetical protein
MVLVCKAATTSVRTGVYGNKQAFGVDLVVAFSFYFSIYFN